MQYILEWSRCSWRYQYRLTAAGSSYELYHMSTVIECLLEAFERIQLTFQELSVLVFQRNVTMFNSISIMVNQVQISLNRVTRAPLPALNTRRRPIELINFQVSVV